MIIVGAKNRAFIFFMFSKTRNFDFILLIPIGILLMIGCITLYSLSPISGDAFLKKQFLWITLGFMSMICLGNLDYRILRNRSDIVFGLYSVLIILLGLLFFAGSSVNDVRSWFNFGGFLLQPTEFLKIVLIILLAKYFSRRHIEIYRWKHIIISGLYITIPGILVLLEPDLGATVVIGSLWILVMIAAGIPWKRLLVIGGILITLFLLLWAFALKPYQKARIVNFINPWKDARGGGYHSIQAMIAVGAGQITGEGIGYGTQSHLHFLPEPETDFIFATFAEEWGLVGSTVLLGTFFFLFWRLLWIARHATNNFGRLFIIGYLFLLFIQFSIHIGGNTGILPITGLTLPFVSYGGSSLLSLCLGLGIVQSIRAHQSIQLDD